MYSHVKHPYFPKIELIRKGHEKIFYIFAVFQRKILSLSQIKEKSNGNKDLNRLKLVLMELKKTAK